MSLQTINYCAYNFVLERKKKEEGNCIYYKTVLFSNNVSRDNIMKKIEWIRPHIEPHILLLHIRNAYIVLYIFI